MKTKSKKLHNVKEGIAKLSNTNLSNLKGGEQAYNGGTLDEVVCTPVRPLD
jgi:hypothetical protein